MVGKNEAHFSEVKKLIFSDDYKSISLEVINKARKILCDDIYDVEIEYCVEMLDASGLLIDDVREKIFKREAIFLEYSAAYMSVESTLEQYQEYNENEMPIEEEPFNEQYVGHSKTFLFQDAIFYLMLKKKGGDLMDFLRKIKKPHAKKFANSLRIFFAEFDK